MAGEPIITVVGNLTADPDQLRYAGDTPVLNFNLAQNRREKVRGEWQDGAPTFFRCNLWRDQAVNAAETLRKGMRVIVHGRQKTTTWQGQSGQEQSSLEIDVDVIGPSLEFATAQVQKVSRNNTQPQQQSGFGGGFGGQSQQSSDPWGGQHAGGGWATSGDQPPPF